VQADLSECDRSGSTFFYVHAQYDLEWALSVGRHVLCDRFTDSTLAYQGAGRGADRRVLLEIDRLATGGRRPDRTLLFDLPAEAARSRGLSESRRGRPGGVDRLDREELAFYERVRGGYLELARAESERFRVIDSTGDREATWLQVREALRDLQGSSG